ncbi:dbf4-type zinc finger-containing protein 2, partial [Lasius niger]
GSGIGAAVGGASVAGGCMSYEIEGYDVWKLRNDAHDNEVERTEKVEAAAASIMADKDALSDFVPESLTAFACIMPADVAAAIVRRDDAQLGKMLRQFISEQVYAYANEESGGEHEPDILPYD